jgi:enoyl-CoA hydratase
MAEPVSLVGLAICPERCDMTPATDYFSLDLDDATGIARLTLARPERMNTMDPGFFPALRDAVRTLDDGGLARVLVLMSTGKHFSAGMSLDVFGGDGMPMLDLSTARKRQAFQTGLRRLMACLDALDEARFPVICAVQGACIGGALDLAAACDIRVCSADAFFTVQEIHIGMAVDLGSLQRLPKIVPQGVARQMAYTGERVDAQRALAIGLVNAVLPDADALATHAGALAGEIASKSPLAVAGSKLALNLARDHGTGEALSQMALLQSAIFDIDEMAQAISAWKLKRGAVFAPLEPLEGR